MIGILFKILKGPSSRVSTDITEFHEGYAYVTEDGGDFYVDMVVNGENKRVQINPDEIPAGGTEGQLLTKTASGLEWKDAPKMASASSTTPKMDGTAAIGSDAGYAKGDHVHPTDTTRQEKITAEGILQGDGNGGVSAAETVETQLIDLPKECFEVVFTSEGSTYTCNKTYAEIRAAVNSGKFCYGRYGNAFFNMSDADTNFEFVLTNVDHNKSEYYPEATIQSFRVTESGITWRRLYVAPQVLTGTSEDRIVMYDHTEGYMTGAVKAKDYLTPPRRYTNTLSASAWNRTTKQLSLTTYAPLENGDATTVEIHVAPVDASYNSAWNTCGIMVVKEMFQGNTAYIYLTFQCSEIPTEDVQVYITTYSIGLKE